MLTHCPLFRGKFKFVSEDTAKDGSNWLEYCGNNPINAVDRNGKNPFLIIGALIALAGIIGGIMECIANGWNWTNFIRGFLVAAVTTAGGLLFGPVGGAIAGAVMGAIEAYCTGGDIGAGILFGAAGGAVGGLSEGVIDIFNGLTGRELAALFLLSADEGLLSGDVGILSNAF